MELAEYAIEMIKKLTDPDVWVELSKPEATPPTELRTTLPAARYETLAEVYGLYAPLEEVLAVTDQYLQQKVIAGWTRQYL